MIRRFKGYGWTKLVYSRNSALLRNIDDRRLNDRPSGPLFLFIHYCPWTLCAYTSSRLPAPGSGLCSLRGHDKPETSETSLEFGKACCPSVRIDDRRRLLRGPVTEEKEAL